MNIKDIKKEIKRVKKELTAATGIFAVKLEEQLETLLYLKSIKSA